MPNQELRHRLGIPDDAEKVLVFSESSHWDPNWLFTAEEYFERFVRHNLDQAIGELQREPPEGCCAGQSRMTMESIPWLLHKACLPRARKAKQAE
ncbi:MAG: hypothetical protein U9O54_06295, partial [Chloroflexota bacterium]|nr:hypothetical protein [Chloroflexota bacterium]